MQIQGTVSYVSSKLVKTPRMKQAASIYSLRLDGDDNWYSNGFTNPSVHEGDSVVFTAEDGQYGWSILPDTIEITARAPAEKQAASPAPAGNGKFSKDDYWKAREARDLVTQKTIQFQAARNAAISTVTAALGADLLPLPSAKGKKFDSFVQQIDELTDYFFANVRTEVQETTQAPAEDDFGE